MIAGIFVVGALIFNIVTNKEPNLKPGSASKSPEVSAGPIYSTGGPVIVENSSLTSPKAPVVQPIPAAPTEIVMPKISPSFNCSGELSNVEQLICSNQALATLDRDLAEAYKVALAKASDSDNFIAGQRVWLLKSRDTCTDAACLGIVYNERIADLRK